MIVIHQIGLGRSLQLSIFSSPTQGLDSFLHECAAHSPANHNPGMQNLFDKQLRARREKIILWFSLDFEKLADAEKMKGPYEVAIKSSFILDYLLSLCTKQPDLKSPLESEHEVACLPSLSRVRLEA